MERPQQTAVWKGLDSNQNIWLDSITQTSRGGKTKPQRKKSGRWQPLGQGWEVERQSLGDEDILDLGRGVGHTDAYVGPRPGCLKICLFFARRGLNFKEF